jgi:hypothetical protein
MPRTGTSKPFTLRLTQPAEDALDAVAEHLGLDRSSLIRFLILQKARELGLVPNKLRAAAERADTPEPPPVVGSVKPRLQRKPSKGNTPEPPPVAARRKRRG